MSHDEQISALLDGELRARELDEALSRLCHSGELRDRLSRYQLIHEALHNNLHRKVSMAFAERVRTALVDEPPLAVPTVRWRLPSGILRQAAGFAIAASVTAVAILTVQGLNESPTEQPPTTAAAEPAPALTPSVPHVARTAEGQRLSPYIVRHNEFSSTSGMSGMLPYVRIVSHEPGR